MAWYMILLNIFIIIVILGLLISLHEAGHLGMAKLFKVYCFEYSIGFGPAILHKRKEGKETYFSLRAIPLGGYVSMYGEEGAVPDGEVEPSPDRSLNAIAKWKKCSVLVAGVTVNFILGLVLIYISDVAFPNYYVGYGGTVSYVAAPGAQAESLTVDSVPMSYEGSLLEKVESEKQAELSPSDYYLTVSEYNLNGMSYRIVDSDVTLFTKDGKPYNEGYQYVAIYYPETLIKEHDLGPSIRLYPVDSSLDASITDAQKAVGIEHLPDLSVEGGKDKSFSFSVEGTYFELDLRLSGPKAGKESETESAYSNAYWNHRIDTKVRVTYQGKKLQSEGAKVAILKEWNGWTGSWKQWAKDVPEACGAIVKGFASLFTSDGFKNMSGLVGMTAALPQIEAMGGAGHIFYFAGLLSINLAFFNLLPFPGLDGWQLVVTAVEAITKKKMPQKVQGIVSAIGFVLLFGLMIAVTIKDIVGLF